MKRFFVLVAVLSVSVAPASARASDEAAILALIEDNKARENACDFTRSSEYKTDDATVFLPNFLMAVPLSGEGSEGREQELCAGGGRIDLQTDIQDVVVINPGAAYAYGVGTYAEYEADGTQSLLGEFSFVYIFEKVDDLWKMRHSHVAQISPAYPTTPPRD